MASEGFQFRALYGCNKEWEEDDELQSGDVLTVTYTGTSSASLDLKDGDAKHSESLGWLVGVNERTEQTEEFPGTYVQYVGPVMTMSPLSNQPQQQTELPASTRPEPPSAQQGQVKGEYHSTSGHKMLFMLARAAHTISLNSLPKLETGKPQV